MELIKPKLISGEIMTLFEEANEKVIIVSPYYNISTWDKLLNCLEGLKGRKISIEFYVRKNEWKSINELKNHGYDPIQVPKLHTKLYMNEEYGIITSMNLLEASDNSSLDIGVKTNTKEEYAQILDYYSKYIQQKTIEPLVRAPQLDNSNWINELELRCSNDIGHKFRIEQFHDFIKIRSRNIYTVSIENNCLIMNGILSGLEFDFIEKNGFINYTGSYNLVEGINGGYDQIDGIKRNLYSRSISNLCSDEVKGIVNEIIEFILAVEDLKNHVYNSNYR